MPALSAHIVPTQRVPNASEHITYMGHAECFLTYSCLALAMRGVFVNFVTLLTCNAVAKHCVFADLYTWFNYNTLYIRLKLASCSHILTKFMDAQQRTALMFVDQGVRGLCVVYVWLGYRPKPAAFRSTKILGTVLSNPMPKYNYHDI